MPHLPERLLAIILLIISSSTFAEEPAAETPPPSAMAIVETFHGNLLKVMQEAKTLGFDGRYKALTAPITETYDMKSIAGIAIGREWKKMDDTQKDRFESLMRDLIISTYASRFSGYSGEKFETLGEKPIKKRHLVNTQLIKSDGEPVKLDYFLRSKKGEWQVFDVVADGVSDLSLKRADYSAIIKGDGLEGLARKMQENINQYKADAKQGTTDASSE
ncbi:MAG: ABC transporter substrate-binding protein [Pseudomonadota bacterium]